LGGLEVSYSGIKMFLHSISTRASKSASLLLLAVGLGIVALGCGPTENLPPMLPVKGKATLDGAPLTSGQVSLYPETIDPAVKIPPSSGSIDSNGNFEIFTGGKSGAPAGKYKVGVTPLMVPTQGGGAPPSLPQKYMNDKDTPLKIEVVEGGKYDLVLEK
jgi:hypothetical protein